MAERSTEPITAVGQERQLQWSFWQGTIASTEPRRSHGGGHDGAAARTHARARECRERDANFANITTR